jgi:hypothetical protein
MRPTRARLSTRAKPSHFQSCVCFCKRIFDVTSPPPSSGVQDPGSYYHVFYIPMYHFISKQGVVAHRQERRKDSPPRAIIYVKLRIIVDFILVRFAIETTNYSLQQRRTSHPLLHSALYSRVRSVHFSIIFCSVSTAGSQFPICITPFQLLTLHLRFRSRFKSVELSVIFIAVRRAQRILHGLLLFVVVDAGLEGEVGVLRSSCFCRGLRGFLGRIGLVGKMENGCVVLGKCVVLVYFTGEETPQRRRSLVLYCTVSWCAIRILISHF